MNWILRYNYLMYPDVIFSITYSCTDLQFGVVPVFVLDCSSTDRNLECSTNLSMFSSLGSTSQYRAKPLSFLICEVELQSYKVILETQATGNQAKLWSQFRADALQKRMPNNNTNHHGWVHNRTTRHHLPSWQRPRLHPTPNSSYMQPRNFSVLNPPFQSKPS